MNFFKELTRQFQKFLLSLKKHCSPRIPIKIFVAESLFLAFYYKSYMVITSAVICPINLDSLQSYLFTFARNWFKVIAAISNYGIFRDKIKFSYKHKKDMRIYVRLSCDSRMHHRIYVPGEDLPPSSVFSRLIIKEKINHL